MNTVRIKIKQKNDSPVKLNSKNVINAESISPADNNFVVKADRTKNLLDGVFFRLKELTIDNFENIFPDLVVKMSEAAKLRDELINEIGLTELEKKVPEIIFITKQIEKKYDSTFESFSKEAKILELEMASLYQKKKLTVYQR